MAIFSFSEITRLANAANATAKRALRVALQSLGFFEINALGAWTRETAETPTSGNYHSQADRIRIHNTNQASTNQRSVLAGITVGHGLRVHHRTFIVEGVSTGNSNYIQFTGYWAAGLSDATSTSSNSDIGTIEHELRFGFFAKAADLVGELPIEKIPESRRMPDPSSGNSGDVIAVNSSRDGYGLTEQTDTKFEYVEFGALVHLGFSRTPQPETATDRSIGGLTRSGLNQVISYYDVDGTFYKWPVPSGGGNMWLVDLGDISSNDDRALVNGSHFYVANSGTGRVSITIGNLGSVFPSGSTIEPGGVVEIALFANGVGTTFEDGKQFNLIVTPHDEEEDPVRQVFYGASAPSTTSGEINDLAWERESDSEIRLHQKTGAFTWTLRHTILSNQVYYQTTVPAASFGVDGDTVFVKISDDELRYYTKESGSWELRHTIIQSDTQSTQDTPRQVSRLPLVAKQGNLVYVEQDYADGHSEQDTLHFSPGESTDRNLLGISKLAGLNLNIPTDGFAGNISIGSGSWRGIARSVNTAWVLDDTSNYLRGLAADRGFTAESSFDINIGSNTWLDCVANNDLIFVLESDIHVYDSHTRLKLTGSAGVHDLGSIVPTGIAAYDEHLYVISDSTNTAYYFRINADNTLTGVTANNISLGTGVWEQAFILQDVGHNYYLYVFDKGTSSDSFKAWYVTVSGTTHTSVARTTKDVALATGGWNGGIMSIGDSNFVFVDDTNNRISLYNVSRATLDPVFDDQRIAGVWIPVASGQTRRGRWHVAYKTDFPPTQSGSQSVADFIHITNATENYDAKLVHIEQRTISGSTYEVYAESQNTIPVNRLSRLNYYLSSSWGDSGSMAVHFDRGTGYAQQDGTFDAGSEIEAGLYNAFKPNMWSRAVIRREPEVLLAVDYDRTRADFPIPENFNNWDTLEIVLDNNHVYVIPTEMLTMNLTAIQGVFDFTLDTRMFAWTTPNVGAVFVQLT